MKILLLEDEFGLRTSIKELLEESGYVVEDYADGEEVLEAIGVGSYDLLLLDVNVPGVDGFELLETLRQSGVHTPAIFITSLTEIDSLERGYDLGCCDYIKKPFDMQELKLRVAAAIRNAMGSVCKSIELPGGYRYDTRCYTLSKDDKEVPLSKTERLIFDLLVKNKDKVVTPQMIMDYVWGEEVDPANVRVQINNLRRKLGKDLIKNVRGMGYRLETAH